MRTTVVLELQSFGREALEAQAAYDHVPVEQELHTAALYFISELGSDRAALTVPRSFEGPSSSTEPLRVDLDLAEDVWTALGAEAQRQDVPVERLLSHAALLYLGDLERGRVAGRIAERRNGDGAERAGLRLRRDRRGVERLEGRP
jgi:hypothetical protein